MAIGAAGAAFMILYLALAAEPDHSVFFAAGMACLLVPLVRGEAHGRIGTPRPLLLLGDASYSIYLVHLPIVAAAGRVLAGLGLGWAAGFTLLVALGVAGGIAYHRLVEVPALNAWRGRGRPRVRASHAF